MSGDKQFSSSIEKEIQSSIVETKQLVSDEERQLAQIRQLDAKIEAIHASTHTLIAPLSPLHNYFRNKWKWYYNWHLTKKASSIHQIILYLYVLGLMFLLFR